MKKLNDTLMKAAEVMKKELGELKKSYSEWDKKYKELSDSAAKGPKQLEDKVSELTEKKNDLDDFVENEVELVNHKLEGNTLVFPPE